MTKVSSRVVIDRPPAEVFRLTQDYALRRTWDPFLRDLRFLDAATEPAAGLRVWVRAWHGLTMTVEYVNFRPPDVVAVKMIRGPALFRSFGGVWRFEDAGPGATAVTFEYGFRLRRAVCWLEPAARWLFARDIRSRLQALKQSAEGAGAITPAAVGCA